MYGMFEITDHSFFFKKVDKNKQMHMSKVNKKLQYDECDNNKYNTWFYGHGIWSQLAEHHPEGNKHWLPRDPRPAWSSFSWVTTLHTPS